MKQVILNKPTLDIKGVVGREEGGTGATSASRAASNLGMLLASKASEPLGPIPLDSNGLIPLEYISGVAAYRAECDGAEEVQAGVASTYQITNFDGRIVYNLSTDNGTAVLSGDKVIYTPGSDKSITPHFVLNAERFDLTYRPNLPLSPNFVKSVLKDVKLFTTRTTKNKMSLSASADFTRLFVGDAGSELGGVTSVGQIESYSVANGGLTRFASLAPRTPGFDVKAITGLSAGSFKAITDAPGWSDAQPTVIPEGSSMLEIEVLGGVPWQRLYGSGSITGAEVLPTTVPMSATVDLEVRTDRRYPAGTYQVACIKTDATDPTAVKIEEVTASLVVVANATTAQLTFGGFNIALPATWTLNTVTTVDLPGTNSYAMLGNDTIISKGTKAGDGPPTPMIRQVKTQRNLNFGRNVITVRNANNRSLISVTGAETPMGVSEYVAVNDNGTVSYLFNPAGKTASTGFGCSLAASDSGVNVIIGENKRNAIRLASYANGTLTPTRELFGPEADSGFGHSVDINYDGSAFVVGAPDKGMIYVGVITNGVPSITASIQNPVPGLLGFGELVKFNRTATRIFASIRTATGQGQFVMLDKQNDQWILGDRINGPAGTYDFGKTFSISEDGHVAVIGAPGTAVDKGRAYVAFEGELGWEIAYELKPTDPVPKNFGEEVYISQDGLQAVVLDPNINSTSTTFGKMYLFN